MTDYCKPVLKWAGGKSQLSDQIIEKMPANYEKYIEPFLGGGSIYFRVNPANAIISDSNPELINLYKTLATSVQDVIHELQKYKNTEEFYYSVRKIEPCDLSNVESAARMIYLNKTCFNGLYRVNKKGKFNSSFGFYKNPNFLNIDNLLAASEILSKATILLSDYNDVLDSYAAKGDFIFLDPPYLPVGNTEDFTKYTKERFSIDDSIKLFEKIKSLHKLGCYILLANSNNPLIYEYFGKEFEIKILNTDRKISRDVNTRKGIDTLTFIYPSR